MKNENKMPQIALGTWSWGVGFAGGDQVFGNKLGKEDLKPVFDIAMKNGLNLWDSAVAYGMGDSEKILGSFAKTYQRESLFLSTKFTPQIAGNSSDPVAEMCDASLERLGTDYIDIYWIHNPMDVDRWTKYLIPLVKSGKVKRVGVSNHNLEEIKRAESILAKEDVHISAIQNHYSLLYRSSEEGGILDYCKENNITFFAYMVLEQGALSGKYNTKNPLPEGSQRGMTYNPILAQIEVLTNEMQKIAEKYDASVSQIAIAWAIAKGTTPIIGVTKPAQVEDAAKAVKINLSVNEIENLEKIASEAGVDTKGAWENPMV
ncbi:aldo/keto reductase [Clostridium sp.]|uniref:aldo/keto reductase n=1 Tax=Clostridium sp. TaxID=1506 RepID=UPI0028487A56|nr:aldo/keto reductase [Clostridium sp.]MDR3594365.1 aldo/keto reductase [Clostridium sp.]